MRRLTEGSVCSRWPAVQLKWMSYRLIGALTQRANSTRIDTREENEEEEEERQPEWQHREKEKEGNKMAEGDGIVF